MLGLVEEQRVLPGALTVSPELALRHDLIHDRLEQIVARSHQFACIGCDALGLAGYHLAILITLHVHLLGFLSLGVQADHLLHKLFFDVRQQLPAFVCERCGSLVVAQALIEEDLEQVDIGMQGRLLTCRAVYVQE